MINIKPEKLHLINFTSYKDETIDFQKIISPTLICGDNGHGKSSIIDAITTALYCRARGCDSRGAGIDDLINKNAKEFTVDYTFTMNNHKYQIVRSKSKSSHKLSFFIDDYDHSSSIKETQQKIINTIKIDYNTFIDTVCIAQNKSSSFMEKSPKDRKEVFAQILNLDDYDVLEKYAREIRKTLVVEYNSLQDELTSLNNKVALKNEYQEKLIEYQYNVEQINIDSLQLKLESLLILKSQQDTIKSKNALILNQRNQLITMIRRYENIISNSKKELQSIVLIDIDQLQQELDSYSLQLNQITTEIEQLQELINDYIVKVSILKKEINIVKTKKQNIQNYNKAICDFCGNTITGEYKQEYINSLNSEGKNIYNQITELSVIINDKQSQLNIKKDIYNELNEKIKALNRKIQSANIDKNRYITLQQNIENNTDELNHLLIDLEKNKKEVIESINEIDENEIVLLKENINRLTNKKNTYLSKIAIIQDRLKQIDEYIVKIKQLEMDLKSRALILDDYKSLINAFSKSGIQSYIIENILPE